MWSYYLFLWSGVHCLHIKDIDPDLWWDSHKVTEEWGRNLPQLKHLDRSLHAHINEQDVQHSAAMKVGDLKRQESVTLLNCLGEKL